MSLTSMRRRLGSTGTDHSRIRL